MTIRCGSPVSAVTTYNPHRVTSLKRKTSQARSLSFFAPDKSRFEELNDDVVDKVTQDEPSPQQTPPPQLLLPRLEFVNLCASKSISFLEKQKALYTYSKQAWP